MKNKLQEVENPLVFINEYIEKNNLNDVKVMVDSKAGTMSVVGNNGGYRYTTTFQKKTYGDIVTNTEFQMNLGKEALVEQVKRLRKEGRKQKEIAEMLGISQGLVSRYSRLS